MSCLNVRARSFGLSVRIYQTLLIVYPPDFRREFGPEMVQVFRAACRHPAKHSFHGLVRFWFHTLVDLVASASAERLSDLRKLNGSHRPYVYLGALLLSLATGYLHLRADADALSIALLLGGACIFGFACPAGAWRLALIVGLGIPAALLVGHGGVAPPFTHRDADLPLPASLIPALIGAYTGAFIHRLLPRLMISSRFGGQQPW